MPWHWVCSEKSDFYLLLTVKVIPLDTKDYLHVCSFVVDQDKFLLRESLSRLPLKMDVPEKVMCQAHGQTRPIADFLHENGDLSMSKL